MVGRICEKGAGRLGPVVRRHHAKCVLRFEVMGKRALRHPCRLAEVLHGGRRKALLADHVTGGFQKPRSRIANNLISPFDLGFSL